MRTSKDQRDASAGRVQFAATLVFESRVGDIVGIRPLCEERVVVVTAADIDEARTVALRHGTSEEHSYMNTYGELVRWHFVGIDMIEPLEPPLDGLVWEVAWRLVRKGRRRLDKLLREFPR